MQNTGWETLISTGVSAFIPYDTLYELSTLYSLQEIYETLSYQLLNSIMGSRILISAMNPEAGEDAIDDTFYRDQIALLLTAETQLLELLRDF